MKFGSVSLSVLVLLAWVGTAAPAARATIQTAQYYSPTDGAYTGQISGGDLVNAGQASLDSVGYSNASTSGAAQGYPLTNLNDGGSSGSFLVRGSDFPETVTFNLNLNLGTGGSLFGYDLTGVNVFAGAASNTILQNQSFQLLVSTLTSGGSFTNLGTFTFVPVGSTADTSRAGSSLQSLTGSTGTIASNVTAVQFVLLDPCTINGTANAGTLYQEIDVLGTASTAAPEPTSLTLFAIGSAGLCVRRRRR